MPLMYACVKELRSLYGNELEVHVNYEDKPDNEFKSLFYFLQGKEKVIRVTKWRKFHSKEWQRSGTS